MMLLTKKNRKDLPALYAQSELDGDAIVYVKFFDPQGGWTAYATEFDGENEFFGLIDPGNDYPSLGYFSLAEMSEYRGRLGLGIERDMHFSPRKLNELSAWGKQLG